MAEVAAVGDIQGAVGREIVLATVRGEVVEARVAYGTESSTSGGPANCTKAANATGCYPESVAR